MNLRGWETCWPLDACAAGFLKKNATRHDVVAPDFVLGVTIKMRQRPPPPALSLVRANEMWELWTGLYMLDPWEKTLFVRVFSPAMQRPPARPRLSRPALFPTARRAHPSPRRRCPQNSVLIMVLGICGYYFKSWSSSRAG